MHRKVGLSMIDLALENPVLPRIAGSTMGGVRVNWLCLEITPNGVLEYWSVGVLVLKTKKR